jgi:hypothetical protein
MKTAKPQVPRNRPFALFLSILLLGIFAGSLTNCGSGSTMPSGPPPPSGNTQVVILLTSTANDQLAKFATGIASIVLINGAGLRTTVYTNQNAYFDFVEWMHLNGATEPLTSVAVPQDTYASAIVTLAGCSFLNETFNGTDIVTATYGEGSCSEGTNLSTVNLPNPIKITGAVMALSLDLQVSQSYTLDATANPVAYTIDPVFTLTPIALAAPPTNDANGKSTGVNGMVTSIGTPGSNFTVQTTDSAVLTLSSNASTAFQGIASFSALAANSLVNFDAVIQPDGTLLATRIEVDNPVAPTAVVGPYILPGGQPDQFLTLTLATEGCTFTSNPFCGNIFQNAQTTVFNTSGQFTNIANLPFSATFGGANLLQGQNLSVTSSGIPNAQSIETASTVTLEPQTLNGMVMNVANDSGLAVYTVALAPYDLFPVLQNYTSFTPPPHLTNPTTILVYADTSAAFLNSGMISAGSLLRFRGLVFDDNGTLKMDCAAIYDGVTE